MTARAKKILSPAQKIEMLLRKIEKLETYAKENASLKTNEEMDGDMSADYACSVLSERIERAREIVGAATRESAS